MTRPVRARPVACVALTAATIAATVVACTRLDVRPLVAAAPGWVAVAFALNSSSMLLRALAWLGVLRGALPTGRIRVWRVVRATMIGVLGSAVAPGRLGEPLRTWLVARQIAQRDALATVVGTLLSQTVLNLVALALLSLVALPGALAGHPLLIVAWPLAVVVAILALARLERRGRLAGQVAALKAGLAIFRQPRRGVAVTTLQLAAWALQTLAAYALLFALHLDVAAPLATAAAVLVAVNVTAAVPLTPSNIGIFQAACVAVLAGAGVSPGRGLAYGLLLQATELVTALALGLPAAAVEFGVNGGGASGRGATTRR